MTDEMNKRHGFYQASLKDPDGRSTFCGRFALWAACSINPIKSATAINRYNDRPSHLHVKGTSAEELCVALEGEGVSFLWTDPRENYTFTQWLASDYFRRNRTYIVLITGHWIVVRGDWLIDTHHLDGHDLSRGKRPFARKRVINWIEVKAS